MTEWQTADFVSVWDGAISCYTGYRQGVQGSLTPSTFENMTITGLYYYTKHSVYDPVFIEFTVTVPDGETLAYTHVVLEIAGKTQTLQINKSADSGEIYDLLAAQDLKVYKYQGIKSEEIKTTDYGTIKFAFFTQ